MATSSGRLRVVGAVALVAMLCGLLAMDAEAQRVPSPPPPTVTPSPPPPSPPPPRSPPPPPSPPPPSPPPPPPSPPPPPPSPPPPPPAKAGTSDIRSRVGTGLVQLTYLIGTTPYYLYTDGGGFAGTLDKTYPGTWWQIGFDSGATNAVTIYSSYGYQAYISNNRDAQVLDTSKAYPQRIWWYFYESSTGTGTFKIGNALGKQVLYEFFSLNGIYTQDGATAFTIVPSPDPVPPPGTVDIRDKVGTGPFQLTYVSGTTTWLAYATGEGVGVTADKNHPSTWWTVGGLDSGPAPTAVTIYHSYTNANLSHNRDLQVVNVNHNYDTRVWWYFYPTNDTAGSYKIGNALTKQVYREFLSATGVYTKEGATAWTLTGVTWALPPPAGTLDISNRVGTGLIQLAYVVGTTTWYAYAAGAGVAGTTDKNFPGTWWQAGFSATKPNLVSLFNSYSDGFLANNRDSQVVDTTKVYGTRIWWYFYETTQSGQPAYKIGNVQGKQVLYEFLSFNGAYTLDGATAFTIVTSTWSSAHAARLSARGSLRAAAADM